MLCLFFPFIFIPLMKWVQERSKKQQLNYIGPKSQLYVCICSVSVVILRLIIVGITAWWSRRRS